MPDPIGARILAIPGYGVYRHECDEVRQTLSLWLRETTNTPYYCCRGCGISSRAARGCTERRVRDLRWGPWQVWLVVEVQHLVCPRCGRRRERLPFLAEQAACTRRFETAEAQDCAHALVARVATTWGLTAETVRQMDKRALQRWAATRPRKPLRYLGVDKLCLGKADKFLTVVSYLDTREPLWAGQDQKGETMDQVFAEALPPRRRRAVQAVCVDMWEPYTQSLRAQLPPARIVYDKFHVLKHAITAVDETRRAEFFRKGGRLRDLIRGKRWLLLARWHHLRPEWRQTLTELFAVNRRLATAYLLREQLEQLWTCTYEGTARRFLSSWLRALRWQRLPAFRKFAALLQRLLDGILAYCHAKVPSGVVEAINANIRAVLRRGRGYRDHGYLVLKVQRYTADRRQRKVA